MLIISTQRGAGGAKPRLVTWCAGNNKKQHQQWAVTNVSTGDSPVRARGNILSNEKKKIIWFWQMFQAGRSSSVLTLSILWSILRKWIQGFWQRALILIPLPRIPTATLTVLLQWKWRSGLVRWNVNFLTYSTFHMDIFQKFTVWTFYEIKRGKVSSPKVD